jgi:hypothetical protein
MSRNKPQSEKDTKDQQRQKQQGGGDQNEQRRQHQQENDSPHQSGKDPDIQEDDSVTDIETNRKGRPPKVEDKPR